MSAPICVGTRFRVTVGPYAGREGVVVGGVRERPTWWTIDLGDALIEVTPEDCEQFTRLPDACDHLDLIRRLRDVSAHVVEHLYNGRCPDLIDEHAERDPECPACAVLVEADALLGEVTP